MFTVLVCTVQGFKRFYLFFFYFVSSFSLLLNMSLMWIWQLIRVDFRDEQRPTEVRESGIIKSVLCCRDVVTPRTKLNSALIVEYVFSFCYWGEIHRYLFSTWHIRIMKNNTPACSQHLQLVSLRIGYFIFVYHFWNNLTAEIVDKKYIAYTVVTYCIEILTKTSLSF